MIEEEEKVINSSTFAYKIRLLEEAIKSMNETVKLNEVKENLYRITESLKLREAILGIQHKLDSSNNTNQQAENNLTIPNPV